VYVCVCVCACVCMTLGYTGCPVVFVRSVSLLQYLFLYDSVA